MTESVKSNWLYISHFLAREVLQQQAFMSPLYRRRPLELATLRTLKQALWQARFMHVLAKLGLLARRGKPHVVALQEFAQAKCRKHTYTFRYVPRKSARQLLWREVHGVASRLRKQQEESHHG